MSGARFEVEFDDRAVLAAIRRLQDLGQRPQPMLRAIGLGLASNTQDRFTDGKDPDGVPWAPLLPAYAAIKRGAGILRESGMNGGLQGSITSAATDEEVVVGSNRIYAAVHQFGAVIRPVRAKALRFMLAGGGVFAQSVTIPARPYLGFSDEDRDTVLDVAEAFLGGAIAGRTVR